jgi:hypothetical protein
MLSYEAFATDEKNASYLSMTQKENDEISIFIA